MTLQDPPQGEITRAQTNLAILQRLAENPTELTDADRDLFGQWSGWGPMGKAFETRDGTWGQIADEVPDLLTPAERETAFAATPGSGANQLLGGAASVAVVDSRDSASSPGTEIGRFFAAAVLANIDFVDYFLKVPPGGGVVFAGATAANLMGAFLEWVELPL